MILAATSLIHQPPSILERLQPAALFARPQPLEIELGSGDGSFLAKYAALHPETNFIGVERLLGRLRKLDKKGIRAGLANLRLVRLEASYLLDFMIPPATVAALHIYFPDPWPKRKHRKNRLINEGFPRLAAKVLQPGGAVWLRTDDLDYFQQMLEVFGASAAFEAVPTPAELSGVITDFERGFNTRGITTNLAGYRLKRQ